MRVFVTGASGWIGSHTTDELLAHGHEVLGLARSDASAAALERRGATPHRGDLDDLDSLRRGAESADAVVHLGFKHDFSDVASAWRTERAAAETLLKTLEGSDRPLLIASGVAFGLPGRTLTEADPATNVGADAPRGGSEALALEYADRGVRSIAARFAPTVHGTGDHGFVAYLVGVARERGVSAYLGDGANRWPAVHVRDAARLNRLALEQAPAGTVVHAVAEEGVPTRDIAAGIAAHLGLETTSIAPEDGEAHFGWMARFFGLDAPTSSAVTRERFGWEPTGPTLLEDLANGAYAR
jgi:nucleoside-diphosphate-sugar epimerase